MTKKALYSVFLLLCCIYLPCAQAEEKITLSTFYPAPYGEYDELAANSMVVGRTYPYPADDNLIVEGSVGIGTTGPSNTWGAQKILEIEDSNSAALVLHDTGQANDWAIGVAGDYLSHIYGSSHYLTIENTGNVGIGTTNPGALLHILQSAETYNDGIKIVGNSGPISGRIYMAGEHLHIDNATAGAGTGFTLDDGGNVGIGTTNPGEELEIFNGDIRIRSDESNNNYLWFLDETESRWQGIIFGDSSDDAIGRLQYNHSDSRMRLFNGDERVTILNNGNIGIGTASPAGGLHIFHGNPTKLFIGHDSSSGQVARAALIEKQTSSPYHTDFYWSNNPTSNAGNLTFYSARSTARVIFTSSGRVGIGTTSPSYQLQLSSDSAGKPGGGSWSASSDDRLKKDIKQINGSDALDKLSRLRGVRYEWINPEEHTQDSRTSITAQNLERVFPEWVKEYEPEGRDRELIPEGENAKAVSFPNEFYAYLIEALKELKTENDNLRIRVKNLEAQLSL